MLMNHQTSVMLEKYDVEIIKNGEKMKMKMDDLFKINHLNFFGIMIICQIIGEFPISEIFPYLYFF
jgi:hypothetical protein